MNQWMDKHKQNVVCPYNINYSAIKKYQYILATTWINLENIMLSEWSQTQTVSYCMIPLIQNIENRQNHSDRKISGSQTLGQKREWLADGYSFWGDEMFWIVVMVTQLCEYTKTNELYTSLKGWISGHLGGWAG